jgi:hypothetical protein
LPRAATECDKTTHTGPQACADIWARVKPSLPEHVQDYAQNIELLRKSQEDVSVDRAERSSVAPTMMDALFSDLEDDNDDQTPLPPEKCSVNDDTLRLACHLIQSRCSKMTALWQMILCLYSNQRQIVRLPPRFQEQVLRQ